MKQIVGACLLAGSLLMGATASTAASPAEPKHPSQRASCIGLIAADHARGIPDGTQMSQLIQGAKEYTDAQGITFGAFISSGAQQHLGSHAVCGNE